MGMKVRVLGAYGSSLGDKRTCGFLIDDCLMLDAGTISSATTVPELSRIDHVLVSHAHLDHCKDLAFLTDLIFGQRSEPLHVWGTAEVLADVQKHLFNNRIWPDFSVIPSADNPIVRFQTIEREVPQKIGNYVVTAYSVNHPVPADGFLIDNGVEVLLYSGDTGETHRIWAAATTEERLAGILLETSFPNAMKGVADLSGHLVPSQVPGELQKLGPQGSKLPVYIYHLKPQVEAEIMAELEALGMSNVSVVRQGETLDISLAAAHSS